MVEIHHASLRCCRRRLDLGSAHGCRRHVLAEDFRVNPAVLLRHHHHLALRHVEGVVSARVALQD